MSTVTIDYVSHANHAEYTSFTDNQWVELTGGTVVAGGDVIMAINVPKSVFEKTSGIYLFKFIPVRQPNVSETYLIGPAELNLDISATTICPMSGYVSDSIFSSEKKRTYKTATLTFAGSSGTNFTYLCTLHTTVFNFATGTFEATEANLTTESKIYYKLIK